jgi:glucosamine-6-phosphate deaminase
MQLIKVKNYREMSEKAYEIVLHEIKRKPDITLGLPTGKTPKGLYKKLIKAYRKGKIDFSEIKTFNLDEYYPVKENDKKSYKYYMFKRLFNKININKNNINLLDGNSKKPEKECKDYEDKIKRNPIDLQILGIGINGHIGFNEPGSTSTSKTRLVNLAPETVKRNKYLDKGLSMGILTILKSKKIILLASGKDKAQAMKKLMDEKISKNLPASFLKNHKNLIVIMDKKAGALL